MNQLVNHKMEVSLPASGDFITERVHIEVGGKGKTAKQVKIQKSYIIAADDF